MPTKLLHKQLGFKIKEAKPGDDEKYIIRGVFSTGDVDRQGEVVVQDGWKLDEFLKNPVILWAHDHWQPAIGKVVELAKSTVGLEGAIQFAVDEYDFAKTIYNLYKGGFMRAFSVGFQNNKYEIDQENDIVYLKENTLFEISAVNVPANAMALAYSKGIDVGPLERVRENLRKTATNYQDFGMADEEESWDGPAEISACGEDLTKLKDICAWYDSENPDVKSSYKLPHHRASDKKVVWKGVAAAMGALLGSRGGVDIPESDRRGVYAHLSKHYDDFEKDAPEFKSYTEQEIKEISETGNVKNNGISDKQAIDSLSLAGKETIQRAIKTLTEVLDAPGTDNQVGEKVETPTKGGKKISVKTLNKAIHELLVARRKIINNK